MAVLMLKNALHLRTLKLKSVIRYHVSVFSVSEMIKRQNLESYKQFNVLDLLSQQKRNRGRIPERVTSQAVEKYMKDRVERLRELYSEHQPELEKVCIYSDPEDKRKNSYGLFPVDENAINSPFELPNFEDLMPNIEDYIEE